MNEKASSHRPIDQRRAVERLLAWGFSPAAIARQLHCSVTWVQHVRRARIATHADSDEECIAVPIPPLKGDPDSR